jgi:hypothetical protein
MAEHGSPMTDPKPTPEYWIDDEYGEVWAEGPEGPVSVEDSFIVSELNAIPEKIRAAVAAEKERCAVRVKNLIQRSPGALSGDSEDAAPHSHERMVDQIRVAVSAERERERSPCTWYDEDECFETSCGNSFTFITDGIKENGFLFCPYCGNRIAAAIRADEVSNAEDRE